MNKRIFAFIMNRILFIQAPKFVTEMAMGHSLDLLIVLHYLCAHIPWKVGVETERKFKKLKIKNKIQITHICFSWLKSKERSYEPKLGGWQTCRLQMICAVRLPSQISFFFYPWKLSWVKTKVQKFVTLFINLYHNHSKSTFVYFITMVTNIQNGVCNIDF